MARRFVARVALTLVAVSGCGRLGYESHYESSLPDVNGETGAGGTASDASVSAGGAPGSGGGVGGSTAGGGAVESGGQGGIGGAIGGNCNPPIKTICKPAILLEDRDTDDDGILDVWDDDDDNDGIPDVVECFSSPIAPLLNGSFEDPVISGAPGSMTFLGSAVPGWDDTASDQLIDFWQSAQPGGVPSASGGQHIQLNRAEPEAIYQDIATVPGLTLRWGFYHRGLTASETVELFLGTAAAPSSQGKFTTSPAAWVQYAGQYVVPAGQTTTRLRIMSITPTTKAGNLLDQIALSPACTRDSDRDGCVDSEDLDSDGDCTPD